MPDGDEDVDEVDEPLSEFDEDWLSPSDEPPETAEEDAGEGAPKTGLQRGYIGR